MEVDFIFNDSCLILLYNIFQENKVPFSIEYFKIKISDMLSKKRSRNYSKPRQLAMALTRELTNLSFPEIGEAYGGRHHTTVMHACDEIEQLRLNNQSIAQDLGILKQVLKR